MNAHYFSNMTIYLNGEIVAKGNVIPWSSVLNLKPESLSSLRKGRNTLAISVQREPATFLSVRLEGLLKASD